MRNSILKFALIASLILNAAVLATAGYRAYRHHGTWVSPFGREMKQHRFLFEELSLKPEQLKALKERTIPFRADIDRRRQEIAGKQKELTSLMRQKRPDLNAVDQTISEISSLQEDMQRKITRHMLEVKSSLNFANQEKFMDLIEGQMSGVVQGCPPEQRSAIKQ